MNDTNTQNTQQNSHLRSFFLIWGGQAVSLLGSQIVQFALVWYLTEETGSATVLAMATLVAMLPQIFLSPIAGALVDRWDRRRVMLAADSLVAVATLVLAALFALDVIQIWHIYVVMFIRSIGASFHWPAMQASTTLMVPEEHLSRIAGINQTLFGAAQIIGPPLGALFLGILPLQGVLAIDVGTALVAIVPLLFVAIPQPEREITDDGSPLAVLRDMREGLKFVWDWPGIFIVIIMATLLNLLANPAFSLLPLYVTDHLGGAEVQFAAIQSASGFGMIAGGVLLGVWGGFKKRIVTTGVGLFGMAIGITAIGLTPPGWFWLAITGMAFTSIMQPIVNGSLYATLQATVPPEMQGRVFTLVMSGASAMSPIGLAIAGPVADATGVPFWFLVTGIGCAIMSAGIFLIPPVFTLEDRLAQEPETEERIIPTPLESIPAD